MKTTSELNQFMETSGVYHGVYALIFAVLRKDIYLANASEDSIDLYSHEPFTRQSKALCDCINALNFGVLSLEANFEIKLFCPDGYGLFSGDGKLLNSNTFLGKLQFFDFVTAKGI
jgi:hypothetical protein